MYVYMYPARYVFMCVLRHKLYNVQFIDNFQRKCFNLDLYCLLRLEYKN